MLAMLYLTLFATLAVGFYATTGTSAQVSTNEQRRYKSLGAAESGMDFARFQLFQVAIPPSTTNDQILNEIYKDLQVQLNGTANMGLRTVGINAGLTQIDIPAKDAKDQYIKVGSDGAKFHVTISRGLGLVDRKITVKVIGAYSDSVIAAADLAAVQLIYDPSERPTDFFDNGMASRGVVTIDTKNPINGAPASEASILSTSAVNPPVVMSSGSISGDITVANGLNPSIAAGTSVGGSSIQADILANHVDHVDAANVEFPTIDVSPYTKYATTMYVAGKPTYDNVFIPANLNPTIAGPVTFRGVLLIKSPNNVKFNGNVTIQGVVVTDNVPVGTLLTNVLTFAGSGNVTSGLDTLPALPQFPPELRAMGGSFLIAPNYDVKFTGNFNAIAGNIVADRINIQGSSDLAITGSVVALKQTLTMGTNGILSFKAGNGSLHTGLRFSDRYVPNPASYDEVKP